MKKIKCFALIMAVILPVTAFSACSKNSSKNKTVKKDDPWYESTRFEIESDKLSTEMLDATVVSYSNGKIFHAYSLTNLADFDNYRRTMLDTYDDKGNLLSQVKIKDPKNFTIDEIKSLKPDAEGKTAEAIVCVFAPGGFETGIVTIDLTSGESRDLSLFKNKDGKTLEIEDGNNVWAGVSDVYAAGEYYIPVIYLYSSSDGNSAHLYSFRGSEYLSELDLSGLPTVYKVEEFSLNPKNNTILTVGYTRTEGALVLEFDPQTGKRISNEKYNVQSADVNLADYRNISGDALCRIDMLGNITSFDIKEQEVKTVIDNSWYTPYFADLSKEDVTLVAVDDTRAVIYTRQSVEYSMFFSGLDENVTILTKVDINPHAGKNIIEIAAPLDNDMSEYLSNAIYEFNRTDNEYLIRVWSKYKTGIKAGRDLSILDVDDEKLYTMIQELNGSEAPDIAIGIQKNYAMRDEVFEDLTGYLDPDVMEKQFANIIEASKIGGKLYFLPVTLEIEGLVTDRSLIKDGACGITFEEYGKMISEDLDGFSPYDYPLSEYNYKIDFVLSCIDTKASIEGGSVDFGTDQFYKAVEYSNELFAEDGFTKPDDWDWDEQVNRTRGACRYDRIDSYIDFVHSVRSSEGSYTIIGTPSVDASGPRFRAVETISVTNSSDMKDGAKKFINFLFAGAGFGTSSKEFQNLVTNKEIMARNMSIITGKNNTGYQVDVEMSEYLSGMGEDAKMFGYKEATEDMEEQMLQSLSSISKYYYDDPVITAFLIEEIAPYYAGDRTLDDAVTILNDRANKYTKEM